MLTSQATTTRVKEFRWLLTSFAGSTSGVEQAVCVASDGLVLGASDDLERDDADRLAAIVVGLRSLSDGAARAMGRGGASQVIVEMVDGYLFVAAIGTGASLAVLTAGDADLGLVGYAMTLFAQRVGGQLDPALLNELKATAAR